MWSGRKVMVYAGFSFSVMFGRGLVEVFGRPSGTVPSVDSSWTGESGTSHQSNAPRLVSGNLVGLGVSWWSCSVLCRL